MSTYNVVVTGFGPFAGHETVNASWEAVRQLPSEHHLPNGRICQLHRQQVDVTYKAVDEAVETIWSLKPDVSSILADSSVNLIRHPTFSFHSWSFTAAFIAASTPSIWSVMRATETSASQTGMANIWRRCRRREHVQRIPD